MMDRNRVVNEMQAESRKTRCDCRRSVTIPMRCFRWIASHLLPLSLPLFCRVPFRSNSPTTGPIAESSVVFGVGTQRLYVGGYSGFRIGLICDWYRFQISLEYSCSYCTGTYRSLKYALFIGLVRVLVQPRDWCAPTHSLTLCGVKWNTAWVSQDTTNTSPIVLTRTPMDTVYTPGHYYTHALFL